MVTESAERYCPTCGTVTDACRVGPDYRRHFRWVLLTGLLWSVVVMVLYVCREPWRCSYCGTPLGR